MPNRFRVPLLLMGLAAAAAATPPTAPYYARQESLLYILADRRQKLEQKEAFERKPFVEKCLIRWTEGADLFEKQRLSGESVLKLIDKWDALQKPTAALDEAAWRTLNFLPVAFGQRFPRGRELNKRNRLKVSRILVGWLDHELFHFRKAGIETLEAMYKTRRLYQPDLDPKRRAERQKDWKKYIDREARR